MGHKETHALQQQGRKIWCSVNRFPQRRQDGREAPAWILEAAEFCRQTLTELQGALDNHCNWKRSFKKALTSSWDLFAAASW
jgi:hypothetical protein